MVSITSAFTYITSEKIGFIRIVLDGNVEDFIDISTQRITYRASRINRQNIYNEELFWIYPESDVTNITVESSNEFSFFITHPFLQTRINFYNSDGLVFKFLDIDFVDNFYNKSTSHFLSVTTNGTIKVWPGTELLRMPYDRENLRAKIVNSAGEIICIVCGYHVNSYSMLPYYFSTWTDSQISVTNGLDVYKRFLPLVSRYNLPQNGEELFFIYNFNGETFYESIFYDSSAGLFYKPVENYTMEGWKQVNDLI